MKYVEAATQTTVEKPDCAPNIIYSGVAGKDVADDEDWEFVIIAQYQSFDVFADFVVHRIYQNVAIPLRNPALEKTLFMASFPCEPGLIPETADFFKS